jgi:8-oxo-dGTP pyrophosphatase MutT (NUDIX family)
MNNIIVNLKDKIIDQRYINIFNDSKLNMNRDLNKNMYLCELSHWYYLDILVDTYNLQKINFYTFLIHVFSYKNMLNEINNINYYISRYNKYKKMIPTAGCIIVYNNNLLVVRVKHAFKYGLPKGKKNNKETIYETAVREVLEETGIDVSNLIINKGKYIEILKTKLYIIELKDEIILNDNYDKTEIDSIKWIDFNYVLDNPREFTNQVKLAVNYLSNKI